MKLTISLLIVIICAFCISAQTSTRTRISGVNSSNVLLDTARFQIIKFGQTAPFNVVKLDRYTGKTYIYGSSGYFSGTRKWILMNVKGNLPAVPTDSLPRYEICEGSEFFFLLNNETGQTWILNQNTWEPVLD